MPEPCLNDLHISPTSDEQAREVVPEIVVAHCHGRVGQGASVGAHVPLEHPADLIVMHPRRWSWFLLQVDTAGRPPITPTAGDTVNMNGLGANVAPGQYSGSSHDANSAADFRGYNVHGYLQGIPVVTSASVPVNLGTGSLEDVVAVISTRHHLLFESGDGLPTQLRFEATLGASLMVKAVSYGYFAYTAGRFPLATSLVGGNAGTSGFGFTSVVF